MALDLKKIMGEITSSEPNITPGEYREMKGIEELKPGSYPFRFMKEAPSENQLMKLLEAGVKDTKKEGIMMARDDRIGTLMNLLEAERMSDNPDLDKIREYEGELFNLMSPRRASEGGDAKEENPLRQFRDDYEMLIGFPDEVLREESKVMMELLDSDIYEKRKNHQQFKDLFYDKYAPTMKFLDSLSEEERKKALDIILSKRAERETDRAEAKGVESLMSRGMAMADGGIVKLMNTEGK